MKQKRFWKFKLCIFLLLFLLIGVAFLLWLHFSPVIVDLAVMQTKNNASTLINDAIDAQIMNGNIDYDRVIYFEKDLNGEITALKTNMSEVNRLKAEILTIINDQIFDMSTDDLGIPMGSIIFSEFFAGRGPYIPIKIISVRNSDAIFHSSFSEAGINQTLHQLILSVSLEISILTPTGTTNVSVSSDVVVAETVIVGSVPETFFHMGTEQQNQE